MKIDIGRAVNTLANLGVIAGIVFLAFELRQNNEMMRAQTRGELSRDTIELLSINMNDAAYADVLMRGNDGEELSDVERYQYELHRNAFIWLWENITYQYEIGLYDEAEFVTQIEVIRNDIARLRGLRDHWCATRSRHSAALVAALEGDAEPPLCEPQDFASHD